MRPDPARRAVVALLALLAAAPAVLEAGFEVDVLYDQSADFSSFTTYRWVSGPINETPEAQLIDKRVKAAADAELAAKGLRRVAEGEPCDLLVTYHGSVEDNLLIEGVRFEVAPQVVWTGASARDVTHRYEVGTLVLDFAAASSEKIVWSGVARTRAATVQQLRERIEKAIVRLLKRYPPD